jgi:hypothetical protein
MNYEGEIAARAFRQATSEGLEGQLFNQRVAQLTQNPPRDWIDAAHGEALKTVLMKKPMFDGVQYHIGRIVNSNILAKIAAPFVQIGGNILNEAFIERSPIGLASKEVRDNLLGRNGPIARDVQRARLGVGVGLSLAVIGAAAEGIITGSGPTDPNERAAKERTGWRPYSIRIGEEYIPFRKFLGPLGSLVAESANLYEAGHLLSEGQIAQAAAVSVLGFTQVVLDESWMTGVSNLMEAIRNWDREGARYVQNLALDFVPFSVGLSQTAHLIDPYRREVHGWLDAALAKIPFASQTLYPKRDIWGEPIPGGTMMSPSAAKDDPAEAALERVQYFPAPMDRKVRGVDLTDRQYDDLTRTAGRLARMRMMALVNQPGFSLLPIFAQKQLIKSVFEGKDSAREMARGLILMQNQSIPTAALEHKQALFNQQPGQTVPKRITQPAATP